MRTARNNISKEKKKELAILRSDISVGALYIGNQLVLY